MARYLFVLLAGAALGAIGMRVLDEQAKGGEVSPVVDPAPRLAPAEETEPSPDVDPGEMGVPLRGLLRDEDGAPLAGVTLRAELLSDHASLPDLLRWRRLSGGEDLDAWFDEARRDETERRRTARRTVTDDRGRFRFEDLHRDGRYEVRAEKPGWVTTRPGRVWMKRIALDFTVIAAPACELTLALRDAEGRVPERAFVRVLPPHPYLVTWSPDRPTITVPARAVRLRAKTAESSSEIAGWTLEPGAATREMVLHPPLELVIDAAFAKERPPRWGVALLPLFTDDLPTAGEIAKGGEIHWAEDVGSPIETERLEPGRHAIVIVGPRREPLSEVEVVAPGRGRVARTLAARMPDLSDYVAVTAVGPEGTPIRDWSARFMIGSRTSLRPDPASGFGDAEGRRWVRRPENSHTLAARRVGGILVEAPGLGARRVPLSPEAEALEVRFDPPATLAVRLVDGDPEVAAAATVQLFGADERIVTERVAPDAEGRFAFGPLQPEPLIAIVRTPDPTGRQRFVIVARHPIDLTQGDREVTIPLGPPATLLVRVPGAAEGAVVRLLMDEQFHTARVDADGLARFTGLDHGSGFLDLEGTTRGPLKVTVPDDREITLGPR
ncbi:MAG: hypothetical protein R3F20_06885 [Planctomycetota bacterium]